MSIHEAYNIREVNRAVRLLERLGFLVRKPSERDLPAVVEVQPSDKGYGQIGVRVDIDHNGTPLRLLETFPFELACDPDNPDFRNKEMPRILADQIGHFLAERLAPTIAEQVKEKIEPFIFQKPLSLSEITSFIEMALDTRYSREDVERAFPQICK